MPDKCPLCDSRKKVLTKSSNHVKVNCGTCGRFIKFMGKKELKELEIQKGFAPGHVRNEFKKNPEKAVWL